MSMTAEEILSQIKTMETQLKALEEQARQLRSSEHAVTLGDFYGALAGKVDFTDADIDSVLYRFDWEEGETEGDAQVIYVTDTHPLVWLLEGKTQLSPTARAAFSDPTVRLVVPTIVLAEIAFLHSRRRISVDVPTVSSFIRRTTNSFTHALDDGVVAHLPTTLNIHDAIIVATALYYRDVMNENVAVITKDGEITASGLVNVVW